MNYQSTEQQLMEGNGSEEAHHVQYVSDGNHQYDANQDLTHLDSQQYYIPNPGTVSHQMNKNKNLTAISRLAS